MRDRASVDLTCTEDSLRRMAGEYLHDHDARDPLASPIFADLHDLPPLLLVVGGDEILLDDSVRLARNAGTEGVDVTLQIWEGMQHIFPIYVGTLPESARAIAAIGDFVRSRTEAP